MADSVVNRSSPTMLRSRALPSIPTQPPTPTAYRLNQYTDATEEKRVAELLCLSRDFLERRFEKFENSTAGTRLQSSITL